MTNQSWLTLYQDWLNPSGDLHALWITHWGPVTHICVSDLTSIGSDNGLSPGRRQAIIRTNAGILLIKPSGTNFSEFVGEILIFSFKKMPLKVSSVKRRPFCLGLNVLILSRRIYYWMRYLFDRTIYLHRLSWTWMNSDEPRFSMSNIFIQYNHLFT